MIDRAGIYTIPAEEYHLDPCPAPSLSSSIAKILCESSPLHAKSAHLRLNGGVMSSDDADHLSIGTIAHALLLGGLNKAEVLEFKDWRTNASQEARGVARANGKIPLLEKHWGPVLAMVTACRSQLAQHKDAKDAFEDGKPEQTVVWQEEAAFGKVWCRARLDWLSSDHRSISDYKSTGATANPEVISRTLFSNGWDIQAAFYLRGIAQAFKVWHPDEIRTTFRFICQETYAPYALSVISLGPDALMLAEKKVQFAIDKWGECLYRNEWPGYVNRTAYANLPAYLEAQWVAREEMAI